MSQLKLYIKETCPYCIKVLDYMKGNDITVELADIVADESNRDELLQVGGKVQVPMLLINKEPLYESDDIITWFKDNAQES